MTRTLKCLHPIIDQLFPLNSTSRSCKGQNSGFHKCQHKERSDSCGPTLCNGCMFSWP